MATILVTGGTGTLGRQVVTRLAAGRHHVRVLSHSAISELPDNVEIFKGDLMTGSGLQDVVADVQVIIHCAASYQNAQRVDVEGTRLLLQAAQANGTPHFIYPSIVGIDRSAYDYYQAKREAEGLIEQGPLPWTIVRITQFHDYVLWLIQSLGVDTRTEISVPEGVRFQSIDVGEVADHLISRIDKKPAAYMPDLGGPQVLTIEEMIKAYLSIKGRKTNIKSMTFVEELFDVFKSGINLVPENAIGTITWEAFLLNRFSQKRLSVNLLD